MPLPPGGQVDPPDVLAADEPVAVGDDVEHVGGDAVDVGVVADDPGQGGGGESVPLGRGEHALLLIPQPERRKPNITCYIMSVHI